MQYVWRKKRDERKKGKQSRVRRKKSRRKVLSSSDHTKEIIICWSFVFGSHSIQQYYTIMLSCRHHRQALLLSSLLLLFVRTTSILLFKAHDSWNLGIIVSIFKRAVLLGGLPILLLVAHIIFCSSLSLLRIPFFAILAFWLMRHEFWNTRSYFKKEKWKSDGPGTGKICLQPVAFSDLQKFAKKKSTRLD